MAAKWCIQCGYQNRPVLAVGVNIEGEPSCIEHSGSSKSKSNPIQSEQPVSEIEKKCPGFEKDCGLAIGQKAELCTRCYARRHYRYANKKATVKANRPLPTNELAALKADLQAKLAAIELVQSLL